MIGTGAAESPMAGPRRRPCRTDPPGGDRLFQAGDVVRAGGGDPVDASLPHQEIAAMKASLVATAPKTPPCIFTMSSAARWFSCLVAPVQSERTRHS